MEMTERQKLVNELSEVKAQYSDLIGKMKDRDTLVRTIQEQRDTVIQKTQETQQQLNQANAKLSETERDRTEIK